MGRRGRVGGSQHAGELPGLHIVATAGGERGRGSFYRVGCGHGEGRFRPYMGRHGVPSMCASERDIPPERYLAENSRFTFILPEPENRDLRWLLLRFLFAAVGAAAHLRRGVVCPRAVSACSRARCVLRAVQRWAISAQVCGCVRLSMLFGCLCVADCLCVRVASSSLCCA